MLGMEHSQRTSNALNRRRMWSSGSTAPSFACTRVCERPHHPLSPLRESKERPNPFTLPPCMRGSRNRHAKQSSWMGGARHEPPRTTRRRTSMAGRKCSNVTWPSSVCSSIICTSTRGGLYPTRLEMAHFSSARHSQPLPPSSNRSKLRPHAARRSEFMVMWRWMGCVYGQRAPPLADVLLPGSVESSSLRHVSLRQPRQRARLHEARVHVGEVGVDWEVSL